jgi:hypothetical protein
VPASPDLLGLPRPGVYPVRTAGTWRPDTSAATAYAFPTSGEMTVSAPAPVLSAPGAGEYTYTVTDSASGSDGYQTVATSFLVVPQNVTESAPAGQVVTQAAGIFITSIATSGAGGRSTFSPSPPITYLNLPLAVGVSWSSAGTDPTTGTTMQLSAAVDTGPQTNGTGRFRVDACGQVYDSWEIHATGSLTGPGENLTLDWRYDVATQLGGLELRHVESATGMYGLPTAPAAESQGSQVVDTVTPR